MDPVLPAPNSVENINSILRSCTFISCNVLQVAASICAPVGPAAGAEPVVDWTHFGCGAVEPLLPGQQAFCVSVHYVLRAGRHVPKFASFVCVLVKLSDHSWR